MNSKIAETLKLKFEPVATLLSDCLPENAQQFKGVGAGCIMSLFAQAAAKGKTAAFSKTTFGCLGAGTGLGFGDQYENFPLGLEAFEYFLSTGLESSGNKELVNEVNKLGNKQMIEYFLKGEGFKKSPDLVGKFIKKLPIMDVPSKYVIFKPLKDLTEEEKPVDIIFVADPDQLSALITLVNYDKEGNNNVIIPWGSGCSQIGIYAFREAESENPNAILGLTDLSARKEVRRFLGKNIFTLTVPYRMFLEMEANVAGSFLERPLWRNMVED